MKRTEIPPDLRAAILPGRSIAEFPPQFREVEERYGWSTLCEGIYGWSSGRYATDGPTVEEVLDPKVVAQFVDLDTIGIVQDLLPLLPELPELLRLLTDLYGAFEASRAVQRRFGPKPLPKEDEEALSKYLVELELGRLSPSAYEGIVGPWPGSGTELFMKGVALHQSGQPRRGLKVFRKFSRRFRVEDPTLQKRCAYRIAKCLAGIGYFDIAAAVYERLLREPKLNPLVGARIRRELCNLLGQMAWDHSGDQVWNKLAVQAEKLGQDLVYLSNSKDFGEKAKPHLRFLEPSQAEFSALATLGGEVENPSDLGDILQAVEAQVRTEHPTGFLRQGYLGALYLRAGDARSACKLVERPDKIDHNPAESAYFRLVSAQAHWHLGERVLARKELDEAQETLSESGTLRMQRDVCRLFSTWGMRLGFGARAAAHLWPRIGAFRYSSAIIVPTSTAS